MSTPARPIFKFGPFRLDPNEQRLLRDGEPVALTPKAFEVLLCLVERHGELLTKEELLEAVWPDTFVEEAVLSVNISTVRKALGDDQNGHSFIETAPRRGYRFLASVETVGQAISAEEPLQRNFSRVAQPAGTIHESPLRKRWGIVLSAGALVALLVLLWGFNVNSLRDRPLTFVGAPHNAPAPKIESLAVLPLENLSRDPEQEYFADGMTEALITDLGKIGALRVISRTSVMQYKGTRKSLPQIARELNVDAIVEGTVLRSGNRVRITANLLDATSDHHLWAESYERDLRDILALQSELAQDITNQIQIKLTPQQHVRLEGARPVDPEAHELYLKGRYYWNKRTPEALKRSLDYFQQAVDKDPQYALGYAGLADSYAMLGSGDYAVLPPEKAFPPAETAARKALELDNTLAEAHASLGWSKMAFDWNWQGAERDFQQAIDLNPGYANAYHWYATYLGSMGRFAEAIAEDRKAESLDPLSLVIVVDVAGEALIPAGQYEQAIQQCRKILEMDPQFALAHWDLGRAYEGKGMYKEAVAEMQKAVELSGGDAVFTSHLGRAEALAGRRDEAIKILNQLKTRAQREFVSPRVFVLIYAALGDKDRAFAWLEKAYQERSDIIVELKVAPELDPLRSDPRFQDLLRRMNFPP